jgi:hypothetical protein
VIVRSVEEIGWAVTSRGGPVETAGKKYKQLLYTAENAENEGVL